MSAARSAAAARAPSLDIRRHAERDLQELFDLRRDDDDQVPSGGSTGRGGMSRRRGIVHQMHETYGELRQHGKSREILAAVTTERWQS